MPKKNDIVSIEITDLTPEGMGVGKTDGYVLFVPKTAVGDVVRVKVVKALSSYGYGRVEEIVTPSSDRQPVDCPVFTSCGGCLFRHITYEAELAIKKSWVENHFARIGKFDVSCDAILPSPAEAGYRNKAQIPCGKGADGSPVFGFFAPHSHRIVPCDACRLEPDFYAPLIRAVAAWMKEARVESYDEETHRGLIRHVFLRDGRVSDEIMVCLVVNGRKLPQEAALVAAIRAANPRVTSILLNENRKPNNEILGTYCRTLWGKDAITDTLCGLEFDISPLSFYQVNHDGAERLYGVAREFAGLTGNETLIDLYCGVGTIGLSMARDVKKLIGVEIIPEAVENAAANAARNGIENAEFFCADAGEAAKKLAADGIRPDVILVDPPRKGCSPDVIDAIAEMAPAKVVMVSCNSATAARDCAALAERGYRLDALRAVDMFPRTGHVESVVLLSKAAMILN